MKIHEYQAKEVFRRYGVATPRGMAVFSVDEAVKAAQRSARSLRREGADPRRRARQGRRREGREVDRRGA